MQLSTSVSSSVREAFDKDGVVVVPGVLPRNLCSEIADAIAAYDNLDWADSATWPEDDRLNGGVDVPIVSNAFEQYILPLAADLVGVSQQQLAWPVTVNRIAVFPNRQQNPDRFRHIDGANGETTLSEHLGRFRVYALLYLTDTPRGGGGTRVWPGTHRWLLDRAGDYENENPKMCELNDLFKAHDPGDGIETAPAAGDVILMHPLCGHAATPNGSDHVRLALRASL